VRLLGAILRLAESLDRSRHSMIRTLGVRTSADALTVQLEARGDAELELWAAHRQLAPLERALDRPVHLEARVVEDGEAAEHRVPARRGLERPARRPRRRVAAR
jgi:hypothetical protein